jgi:hypothetical protein
MKSKAALTKVVASQRPTRQPTEQAAITDGSPKTGVAPSRQGKKAIGGFFDPAVSRQLKQLGIDQDKPVQELLREAINDFFQKHGKSPIA